MANILFIKTSSLGDVIHHMPAIAEARRHLPDARFAWVVEEAFAPLVRLHPAVDEVIPVAARRWRRARPQPGRMSGTSSAISVRAATTRWSIPKGCCAPP
jgi:heptosyltransferase-1